MLKNGEEFELADKKIKKPIGGLIIKIANGVCWKEKLEMDTADGLYKALVSNLEAVQSELNGYQSIYKYLSKL